MTQKSYNHIFLPQQFIKTTQPRDIKPKSFNPTSPEVNKIEQKQRLFENMNNIKTAIEKQNDSLIFRRDKSSTDIEIEFFTDYPRKFIDKYNIQTYSIDWNKVIGKISVQQLENEQSAFHQLVADVSLYKEEDKQKSYLWTVKKIEPLSYKKIINPELYEKLKSDQKLEFDIVIEWNVDLIKKKIDYIKTVVWEEDFIWKYTSNRLNFCRVAWTILDLEELDGKYLWVSSIEPSPQYSISPSSIGLQDTIQKQTFSPPDNAVALILLEKWRPDPNHELIEDTTLDLMDYPREYVGNEDDQHATAVASLIILWSKISPIEDIEKQHKVIPIMLWNTNLIEQEINDITEKMVSKNGIMIANLSFNDYWNHFYNRSKIHSLTIILDKLMHEHNVLFFISVGNILTSYNRNDDWSKMCLDEWYPEYFWFDFTNLLPPSDCINWVSVWSISYSSTRDSIAERDEPSPHTRKNPNNDDYIKPDLVHLDGNWKVNSRHEFEAENNWVYMACHSWKNMIKKENWTSFATPLCTHIAGHILKEYPQAKASTIKALLIHFSDVLWSNTDNTLVWHWTPDLSKIITSFSNSATIVVETSIKVWDQKTITFPIPPSLQWQHWKRLSIRRTLVYNPPINRTNTARYNPIQIFSKLALWWEDEKWGWFSNWKWTTARPRSNVKKYWEKSFSTKKYWDKLRSINLWCVCDQEFEQLLEDDFEQKVSIILTIEDTADSDLDIYSEIVQLIDQNIQINT